ncbi:unnamed protein product [Phytophthora fragariaefolia]|uniref:Unnamed protein product n=1 Tax=Phytophthora fragariaefolia TaxID=1490495 RepID=A0A9W6YKV8_9STRA|nr:unnamed protein product [Phytophthora fragariaefolia]
MLGRGIKLERVLRRRVLAGTGAVRANAQAPALSAAAFSAPRAASERRANALKMAAGGVLVVAAAALSGEARSEQKPEQQAEGGYDVNPIQNVTALLRLYEQIDQNMSVFAARMLEDLEKSVEKEKKDNGGKLKLSPEQRALNMSIAFESTLEKVQDAVFRNNYVTKEHVREAMQQLVTGTLRGGGPDGKISEAEAETIEDFVRKLGRLRWKVTGSRDPLIPGAKSAWVSV